MSPTADLVCVGHLVKETIFFPDRTAGPLLGSPPAYCSIAAARQGTPTAVVTSIGPDFPSALLQPLRDAGVDMSGVRVGDTGTTSELIYDTSGGKSIRYPSRAAPLSARDVPASLRERRLIYVCTMDNDVPLEEIPAVAALARESAVDLGGYGGVHMSRERRDACPSLSALALAVARSFTVVKASDEDLKSIFGRDDPEAAVATLRDQGVPVVVVTMGAQGALVGTARGMERVPAASATVADTTGGGDTFMAGFLSEYIRSGDPLRAARWGCATAAFVIERTGGAVLQRMPTFAQVQERFSEEVPQWTR